MSDMVDETKEKTGAEKPMREISVEGCDLIGKGGNIMLSNGEVLLIDVDDSGLGHPIFDLAGMYLVYVTAAKTKWKTVDMGITREQFARIWDIIIKKYFNTTSESEIAEINRIIYGYSMVNMIKGVATSPSVPNFLRGPVIFFTKRKLMKMVDMLHPIP